MAMQHARPDEQGHWSSGALEPREASAALSDAIKHTGALVHAELDLAKAEFKYELNRLQLGMLAGVLGACLTALSLLVVAVALAMALQVGPFTLAALGAALAVLGVAIAWWGRRRLTPPSLERTRQALATNAIAIGSANIGKTSRSSRSAHVEQVEHVESNP
jgi:uncharacterized membrane protein YqjE